MSTKVVAKQEATGLAYFVKTEGVMNRFKEVLGARAPQFASSLLSLANASDKLMQADPRSVVAAAMTAAVLDLPIQKDLGFAHIIPYAGVAQFQMGYKGFVQLAMRSGQYKGLNACTVFEGELISADKLRGMVVLDESKRSSDKVIGYAAYMALTNGFERSEYWSVEKVTAHASRFSQAYKSKKTDSPWFTSFDQMGMKTAIKSLLSHWGPLSVQMQTALREDQAIHRDIDAPPEYIDGTVVSEKTEPDNGDKGTAGLVDKLKGQTAKTEPLKPADEPNGETTTPADPAEEEKASKVKALEGFASSRKVAFSKACQTLDIDIASWRTQPLERLDELHGLMLSAVGR